MRLFRVAGPAAACSHRAHSWSPAQGLTGATEAGALRARAWPLSGAPRWVSEDGDGSLQVARWAGTRRRVGQARQGRPAAGSRKFQAGLQGSAAFWERERGIGVETSSESPECLLSELVWSRFQ